MSHSDIHDLESRLERVRSIVRDILIPLERRIDQEDKLPDHVLYLYRTEGWFGLTVPREFGGQGLPMTVAVRIMQEIGFSAPVFSSWLMTSSGVVSAAYRLGGNAEQQREYLPKLASGELIGAVGVTDGENGGSDLAMVGTTARLDGDRLILNGRKRYVGLAAVAGVILILCRLESQVARARKLILVAVPGNVPGLVFEKKSRCLGLRGVPLVDFELKDCIVPVSAVIGSLAVNGLALFARALDYGHLMLAASHAGLIGRLIHEAVCGAASRRRFGRFLIDQPVIQQSIAAMTVDRMASDALTDAAARLADQGQPFSMEATAAKIFATEASCRSADRAVQILGADGVLEGSPVEQFYRDVRGGRLMEGANEVLASTIASHAVSGELRRANGAKSL
ncbi:putative Acyl-CoA dehydrogenase [Azospirillaceae bacterium]